VFLLFRQFLKKKTIGTALLAISFLFIAFGEIATAVGETLYFFKGDSHWVGYLILFYPFFYSIGYIFFYYFANRHILQDKDFVRVMTTVFLTTIISFTIALMVAEIMFEIPNPRFYQKYILAGVDIALYLPQLIDGIALYLSVFSLIQLRIVFRLIRIRRDVENHVARKGFTYILASVMLNMSSSLIASLYMLPKIHEIAILVGLIHTLRGITATISVILGYFGWILPDWLKRRIHGKAWIVKQMSKEITGTTEPIASSFSKKKKKEIVEIVEK